MGKKKDIFVQKDKRQATKRGSWAHQKSVNSFRSWEVIGYRKRSWEKSGWLYTRGLIYLKIDMDNATVWENQICSSILDGWEVEMLLLLEMWVDILHPEQARQLYGWIRRATSLTHFVEDSFTALMCELKCNSGNIQVTRLSESRDNGIIQSKAECGNGEELGRELRNCFLKYLPCIGSGRQVWGRELNF